MCCETRGTPALGGSICAYDGTGYDCFPGWQAEYGECTPLNPSSSTCPYPVPGAAQGGQDQQDWCCKIPTESAGGVSCRFKEFGRVGGTPVYECARGPQK